MRRDSNGTRGTDGRRGSAYVEYFIAAAAVAAASIWLFQGGDYQGIRATIEGPFDAMMADIAGPVS